MGAGRASGGGFSGATVTDGLSPSGETHELTLGPFVKG